jgi:hypothetical protein
MFEWIVQDPAMAGEWYNRNWDSLPAIKRQYVAEAYARYALKNREQLTARQWANFIRDDKLQDQILLEAKQSVPK